MSQSDRFAALGAAGSALDSQRDFFRCDYGPEADQFLEVHGDPSTASATVFFVHGGYFRERTDLAHARPMAAALAEAGVLCVLIEYRRVGGQPNCSADVTAALTFAYDSLSDWGVNDRARRSLTVTGHSAGGCLVLAWASHLRTDGPEFRLRPLAPVTDLFREVEDGLGEGLCSTTWARDRSRIWHRTCGRIRARGRYSFPRGRICSSSTGTVMRRSTSHSLGRSRHGCPSPRAPITPISSTPIRPISRLCSRPC